MTDKQKAIDAIRARRAARGANDPLAKLHAHASGKPAIVEQAAPRVIECAHLVASDFDGLPGQAPNNCVIVKTARASNFRVERHAPGVFIAYGRAEFLGGSQVVRGIEALRRLLASR